MKDKYQQALGKRIEMYRKLKGMTMQELADKSGYGSKSSIHRLENGTNDISHRKLQQVATALDLTVKDLLDGLDVVIETEQTPLADKISQLNELNLVRLQAYVDALLDNQKGDKE